MMRVELTEQGRGPKNRKQTSLGLLTTCTSEVCLCTLWLGGAGAESCRAGPPPPYTGTDWVSNSSPAEARNQTSHTTCPRGVRSWQADVVRQSSRCRLDSDCFPLSLTSATGDPHLSCQNNASKINKLRSQSVLPRMVSHGDKGRRPKNRAHQFSAQVSLIYARGICSAGTVMLLRGISVRTIVMSLLRPYLRLTDHRIYAWGHHAVLETQQLGSRTNLLYLLLTVLHHFSRVGLPLERGHARDHGSRAEAKLSEPFVPLQNFSSTRFAILSLRLFPHCPSPFVLVYDC